MPGVIVIFPHLPLRCAARHPGRVFLLHGDSASPPAEEATGAESRSMVLDYAAGWKHSVVLVSADDGDTDSGKNDK